MHNQVCRRNCVEYHAQAFSCPIHIGDDSLAELTSGSFEGGLSCLRVGHVPGVDKQILVGPFRKTRSAKLR